MANTESSNTNKRSSNLWILFFTEALIVLLVIGFLLFLMGKLHLPNFQNDNSDNTNSQANKAINGRSINVKSKDFLYTISIQNPEAFIELFDSWGLYKPLSIEQTTNGRNNSKLLIKNISIYLVVTNQKRYPWFEVGKSLSTSSVKFDQNTLVVYIYLDQSVREKGVGEMSKQFQRQILYSIYYLINPTGRTDPLDALKSFEKQEKIIRPIISRFNKQIFIDIKKK